MKRVGIILLLLLLVCGGWFLLMPAMRVAQNPPGNEQQNTEYATTLTNAPPPGFAKPLSMADWLLQHDAGMKFLQLHKDPENTYFYPDTVQIGKLQFSLGEEPPRYCYQLAGPKYAVLIAEDDDRRVYHRSLDTVRVEDGELKWIDTVSIEYPIGDVSSPMASPGGFVLLRNEKYISQVGVIIPDLNAPPGIAGTWVFSVKMRDERPAGGDVDLAAFHLQPEPIDDSKLVLLPSPEGVSPLVGRILWLKIDATGKFIYPPVSTNTAVGSVTGSSTNLDSRAAEIALLEERFIKNGYTRTPDGLFVANGKTLAEVKDVIGYDFTGGRETSGRGNLPPKTTQIILQTRYVRAVFESTTFVRTLTTVTVRILKASDPELKPLDGSQLIKRATATP
jgi:hypothetical protein